MRPHTFKQNNEEDEYDINDPDPVVLENENDYVEGLSDVKVRIHLQAESLARCSLAIRLTCLPSSTRAVSSRVGFSTNPKDARNLVGTVNYFIERMRYDFTILVIF